MSAVSKKLMPASSAAFTTFAVPSASSRRPKLLQPIPTTETSRLPIRLLFIVMEILRYYRAESGSSRRQASRYKLKAIVPLLATISACARPAVPSALDEPIETAVAVATFDSLYSKVANTYVDTAFTSHQWVAMRNSLRDRKSVV